MASRVGVIGGTGFYTWEDAEAVDVETAWGDVTLHHAQLAGRDVFFVARHGPDHSVPAHRVEYRALVAALRAARCTYVLAVNNAGSLRKDLNPGAFVVPEDLLDRTRSRVDTFGYEGTVHVHLTPPYCPTAADALAAAAGARRGVYAAVEGPRFETPAEARVLAGEGADVVGMTGYPEVALAREAAMHYASLVYVANHAPGIGRVVSARTIQKRLRDDAAKVRRAVTKAVEALPDEPPCACLRGLRSGRLSVPGA